MAVNWRAMQLLGAASMRDPQAILLGPTDIRPRYMTMGSWKCTLAKVKVARKAKGEK